ncbi:MAG: N-acetylmuramic acid 6-phosphate etherase [Planctomycetota bacterium]
MPQRRGHLLTEQANLDAAEFDAMSLGDAFDVMAAEDAGVAAAVAGAKESICAAIELVVAALRGRGRLLYVGAGTSGRLGVLDASECPPTFCTDPERIQAAIAGGWEALRRSSEGAEDDPAGGAAAVVEREIGPGDVVVGISAGGTTLYVHGALAEAARRGARTVFLACVPREQVADAADVSIRVPTGPEVLAGSTRLKAGTATKLVLNMLSTLSMVRLGKVYGNRMVDLHATANAKLIDRGRRILEDTLGLDEARAAALFERAGGRVKIALVMHVRDLDCDAADAVLAACGGVVRDALQGGD